MQKYYAMVDIDLADETASPNPFILLGSFESQSDAIVESKARLIDALAVLSEDEWIAAVKACTSRIFS
jgi:hypothetical protein